MDASPSSSFVIPDDPLISPLYEAMFPFSVSPRSSSSSSSSTVLPPPDAHFLSAYNLFDPESISTTSNQSIFPAGTTSLLAEHPLATLISSSSCSTTTTNHDHHLLPFADFADIYSTYSPAYANRSIRVASSDEPNKHKYYCEACKVRFGTSQALGGHMSSHSKSRRRAALSVAAPNWKPMAAKSKNIINKSKLINPRMISRNTSAKLLPVERQGKIDSCDGVLRSIVTEPPEAIKDCLSCLIDQIWLNDVCDQMDFSSLFDN
ncbi:hypothetical protein Cni_G04113 [Canna indica]|uniref:C2H2-type domain-containing protein n=1 Tax=Canna indica TaxID=4628 RepID=A0AAQ3JSU4_9LILI|nr:hypothetical protein Cni_G04113 [Canna indica]